MSRSKPILESYPDILIPFDNFRFFWFLIEQNKDFIFQRKRQTVVVGMTMVSFW